MNVISSKYFSKIVLPLLITLMAACWLLPSLGNGMLWQDEAQTALLARTTLAHGVPIAFDGANSISQERGDDCGPHGLWKWHMWLPFYLLAGFFKLFGESTAVARLPFALMGVATVVLCYFTGLSLWRDAKTAALSAFLLLACVPFALLVRQCRYYSLTMFFSLLMLDVYIRMCRGWPRGWILLAIAGTLLFNSHFVYCGTVFAAIALHAVIWHRDQFKALLLAALVTGVLCAPPFVWLASLNYKNYHMVLNWHFALVQLAIDISHIFLRIIPYPLLLIPVAAAGRAALKHQRITPSIRELEPWALPVFFSVITVAAVAPFTPQPFFRYMAPLIAPLLILLARWVIVAFRTQLVFGALSIAMLALWWPESQYFYELQHRFVGPLEGIVQLLNERGKPGDVVVASYEDLPLKFYTRYRVLGGNTGEDLSTARGARWLILRRWTPGTSGGFIEDQIKQNPNYRPIVLNVPDTEFENREEPEDHLYGSMTGVPPVVIYELKETPK